MCSYKKDFRQVFSFCPLQKYLAPKKLGSKNFVTKKGWSKKFWSKKKLSQTKFGPKQIYVKKKIFVQNFFASSKNFVPTEFGSKTFCANIFLAKFFFVN